MINNAPTIPIITGKLTYPRIKSTVLSSPAFVEGAITSNVVSIIVADAQNKKNYTYFGSWNSVI